MKGLGRHKSAVELSIDDLLTTAKPYLRGAWQKHVDFLAGLVNTRIEEPIDLKSRENMPKLGMFAEPRKRPGQNNGRRPDSRDDSLSKGESLTKDELTLAKIVHGLMEFSIEDGDLSSEELAKNISIIIENIYAARQQLQLDDQFSNKDVEKNLNKALESLVESIVILQFYDRISQRITHAISGLQSLYESGSNHDSELYYEKLYDALGMEDARVLFKAIEKGESIDASVRKAARKMKREAGQKVDWFK